jgi:exosortase D (VPLPA-CTERM-specific)
MTESPFKFQTLWKPLLVAAALAFVYATVLVKLGRDWWTDENYSHGLLVPFVIGYVVWLEFDELKRSAKNSPVWFGVTVILGALFLLLVGTLGAELFTQRISFVLMLVGIVIYFFGAKILYKLVVPFALLIFSIPIPTIIFNKIAFPLQIWASQIAVWGIRIFEVPSVRKGNIIELLPKGATQMVALEVVEACSGIRSLMTLVTLALILAYFTQGKSKKDGHEWLGFIKDFDFWRAVILMLSAIPIAILTNAARVTATGILTYYYGKHVAEGAWHDFSGWLVFLAALILLMLVNLGLKKIHHRVTKSTEEISRNSKVEDQISEPALSTQHRALGTYQTISLIIALFFGGIFINWFEQRAELQIGRRPLREIPVELGAWRQMGTDTRFSEGTESVLRTTDYVMRDYLLPNGRGANLYVGYYASQRTGATYHSPQNCLPGSGWEMKNPELVEIKTPSGLEFAANRYIVQNGDHRQILIYWYQGRGRATASEYRDKVYTVVDSIFRQRSDGAMVRIMTPVGDDEKEVLEAAVDLSAHIADKLAPFVPE